MLNRNTVKMISNDIEKALGDVANKYNVDIKRGNASFSSNNMTLKLNVSIISDTGDIMTKEATDYNLHKNIVGLTKELGDTFYFNGAKYTIKGYKPRSRKYPVVVSNGNGLYKMSINMVNNSPTKIN